MASYFLIPKVYLGKDAMKTLRQSDHKKVRIVTDSFMVTSGKVRYLINRIAQASVSIFRDVKPDSNVEILQAGAARFKAFNPDIIIALEGGSSLDAASYARGIFPRPCDFPYFHPHHQRVRLKRRYFLCHYFQSTKLLKISPDC